MTGRQFTQALFNAGRLLLALALLVAGGQVLAGTSVTPTVERNWPTGWLDADGDCQDTETEVLLQQPHGLIQWGDPEACTIASGNWKSWAYDREVPLGSVLVVPLIMPANADASGAGSWSQEKKKAFLNDFDNLIVLDVVSAPQRGNAGPQSWRPAPAYWCDYATRWQKVKQRYGLSMSKEEKAALLEMKQKGCTSGSP